MKRYVHSAAATVAAAALCASVVAGCGDGSSTSTSTTASGKSDPAVSAAKQELAKAGAPPSSWSGPETSPPAAAGKSVAIISCSQTSDCARTAGETKKAAEAIGWRATIFDARGNPTLYNTTIRNASNSGYSGIITIAIPPALAQDGLRYADQRKVPVVNGSETDSTDPLIYGNAALPWAKQGKQIGQWLVADSDGKAGVYVIRDDEFPGIKIRQDEVLGQLRSCSGCTVLGVQKAAINQLTNPTAVSQMVTSAIARYGDKLSYIVAPFGSVDGLVVPALRTKARTDVKVASYDGNDQQMQLCREKALGAVAISPSAWIGWASVDTLNRAFNDEQPTEENIPSFLVTEENCPESGTAEALITFDFQGQYKKLWKVG